MADNGPVTTAGVIAVGNLQAQIDGQLSRATEGRLTVGERAELVESMALRGHVLGCVADSERAAAMAEELVCQVPSDARSLVARARTASVFHRFAAALTDLDAAVALGGDGVEADAERAAIYQALGRYDEALAIRRAAFDRHADFSTTAALAGIYGERGELDEAERWFTAARRRYRGTSPFPVAMLELQRGQLWMERDDLRRARAWCGAAVRRLPAYAPAQGHLGELEAALGDTAAAIARLRPLALASDDPDYATQLARILGEAGRTAEAQAWRGKAQARYDELLARHPHAFADHAAEFWLTIGGDPERALWLARQNLSLRQTPRARALVRRSSGHRAGITEKGDHMSASSEPISFEQDIKPLFREHDRESMKRAFDLWSYDDVVRNSDAIVGRLHEGTMPCDGAWPQEQVAVVQRWIDEGMPA